MSIPAGGAGGAIDWSSAARAGGSAVGMCIRLMGCSPPISGMCASACAGATPMLTPYDTSAAPGLYEITIRTWRERGGSTSCEKSAPRDDTMLRACATSRSTCRWSVGETFSAMMIAPASSFQFVRCSEEASTVRSPCSAVTSASAHASSCMSTGVGCTSSGCVECTAATYRRGSVEASCVNDSGSAMYSASTSSISSVTLANACSAGARGTCATTVSLSCRSGAWSSAGGPPPRRRRSMPRSSSVRAPVPPRSECPS
mmetsp:Transcript_20447/g.52817  ORF Transcript_20447/g.52817 Transcript_20447/m.52817 type:complete len:258 (-) Transcript_20447:333-1106(-)